MTSSKNGWEQAVLALRRKPEKQDMVRDCYYDDPLPAAAQRFYEGEEWNEVRLLLKPKGRVLEVGAGRGIATYAFCKEGCSVTALEPDSSEIVGTGAIRRLMQSTGHSVEILEKNAGQVDVPDEVFNIIYGRAILHHINDLYVFFKEVYRLLQPGGKFLFTREHVISKPDDLQEFLNSHALHYAYGGENAFALKEYLQAIRSSGLRLTKIIGPFDSPINRYPKTNRDFERQTVDFVNRVLPKKIAESIGKTKPFQKLYGWHLSQKSQIPGRLYSFMGEK